MKVVIDRFEGDFAVVELDDNTITNLPMVLLTRLAKEGDVVEIRIDDDETERRKKRIEMLQKDVWE